MEQLRKADRKLTVKEGPDGVKPSRWINYDLAPVPAERRTWNTKDIFSYWISDQFSPATWNLGSSIINLGLTAREGIPLTFAAFFAIGIVLTLNGRIGAKTHLPFPVIVRASFGMYGGYLAILIRSILALIWLCILTYQAGAITAVMLTAIWPSYGRIKNTLPEGMGITSQTLLGFAIFWIIQTPLSLVPVHKLRYFFWFKSIVCPIAFFALFVWGLVVTKGHAPYIDGPTQVSGSKAWAVITAVNICTGLFSTMSINIADFSRFTKSNAVNWSQLAAVPISGTIPVICSIIATAAAQSIWGVAAWDPATLIALFDNRACKFFAGFAFVIATIGSNISTNSISFATDITSVFPRYLTIFRASVLAAILCFAVNPWKIVTDAPSFINFLGAYPVFLAPVAIIITVDFYIVRKGRIDIRELFDPKGIYSYRFGVNFRAVAAWIIALAPNLPAFAHAVDPTNPDPQPYTYRFSWYFSTFAGAVAYYLINLAFPPKRSFVSAPVYEFSVPEGLVDEEAVVEHARELEQKQSPLQTSVIERRIKNEQAESLRL